MIENHSVWPLSFSADSGDWDTPKIYIQSICVEMIVNYVDNIYIRSILLSFVAAVGTLYTVMQTTRPNGRSNKSNNEARPAVDFLHSWMVGVWCGVWVIT